MFDIHVCNCISLLQDVIILGLTDIWSAIRNACVSRLSHVIEHFSLLQLQSFFNALVKVDTNMCLFSNDNLPCLHNMFSS